MAVVEKQKHKCDICGNITTNVRKLWFGTHQTANSDNLFYRIDFEVCPDCYAAKEYRSSWTSWFKKIWRKP